MHGMTKREYKITDEAQIQGILDSAKVLRLGIAVDNVPYIIPLNYGCTLEDGKLTFYLHSAVKGNKLDLLRKNPEQVQQLTALRGRAALPVRPGLQCRLRPGPGRHRGGAAGKAGWHEPPDEDPDGQGFRIQ